MYPHQIVRNIEDTPTSLQVVWVDHEDDDGQLSIRLEQLIESYNTRLPPTRLLFVCPSGVETRIHHAFKKLDHAIRGRLKSISHISIASYNKSGRVANDAVVPITPEDTNVWQVDDDDVHAYAMCAVESIFDSTKTLLRAPHGYRFRKPSRREEDDEDYFVRAENLLREPTTLPIFSYLILRAASYSYSVIYIDSFTILSFALGLRSLIRYFRTYETTLVVPTIESFHSYQIGETFRIPNESNYLILISASTTGRLAEKLVAEKQADPARIVHLLGVAPPQSVLKESCIYFRQRPTPNSSTYGKGVIEVPTEEFLVTQGLPRPVRITELHVNKDAGRALSSEFYTNFLKFREAPNHQAGYSTFSVNPRSMLQEHETIKTWIHDTVVHAIPASVSLILHLDDDLSRVVAEWISDALQSDLRVRPTASIGNETIPESIVVVAFQDNDLEGFGRTNIALRNDSPIRCHYVLCFAFPESGRVHRRIKDDLRFVHGGRRQGWSEYVVLPVGNADLHESFYLESQMLSDEAVEPHRGSLGSKLAKLLCERHMRQETPGEQLFLPCVDGRALKLRPGSVFFDAEGADPSQVAAYAMVAAAMQKAREGGSPLGHEPDLVFDDNPFVRSVLDPRMFVRFNDGVLQASLLRASSHAELDYSASDLGNQFTAMGISVLRGCDNQVGEAALEFVYALATEKVSLRKRDRARLRDAIASSRILSSVYELFRG